MTRTVWDLGIIPEINEDLLPLQSIIFRWYQIENQKTIILFKTTIFLVLKSGGLFENGDIREGNNSIKLEIA